MDEPRAKQDDVLGPHFEAHLYFSAFPRKDLPSVIKGEIVAVGIAFREVELGDKWN